MRRLTTFAALLAVLLAVAPAFAKTSHTDSAIAIVRPTVIAFYPSEAKVAGKDDDANSSLSDFQLYTASAEQRLQTTNVAVETVFTRSFEVVQDGKTLTFRPARAAPGYYFAMPGKKPRIEYGVMTDADILRTAQEYFGNAMKQ
jgi:hypothetical protein